MLLNLGCDLCTGEHGTCAATQHLTYPPCNSGLVPADYTGRYTVPVLWDKTQRRIVSNESSEILRMLNAEFNAFCATPEQRDLDLYPEPLRGKIDEVNAWIYP